MIWYNLACLCLLKVCMTSVFLAVTLHNTYFAGINNLASGLAKVEF